MTDDDALIAYSFPPYSRQTLDVLTEAKNLGATTLTFTDRHTSPAADIADHAFAIKSDNMMFTNAVAAVTVLTNGLISEIATRHRSRAIDAFAHINRVLADDDGVLPPER
jgi:DNA-binding MurR/RpiR family transcriptional regulator